MTTFTSEVIGIIRSPFTQLASMPIQPAGAKDVDGEIEVEERFAAGLKDLEGFSHIILLYHFHQARRMELEVVPFLDTVKRGVFATRSPLRPAHIGLSIVEVLAVFGNRVRIRGVDILDGTPLLDIKPYVPQFDHRPDATSGWMRASAEEVGTRRSDDRFL
jgi:tRNA (adenine37-N6)-methyltransferase